MKLGTNIVNISRYCLILFYIDFLVNRSICNIVFYNIIFKIIPQKTVCKENQQNRNSTNKLICVPNFITVQFVVAQKNTNTSTFYKSNVAKTEQVNVALILTYTYLISLSQSNDMSEQNHDYAIISSFQILSNSLFDNRCTQDHMEGDGSGLWLTGVKFTFIIYSTMKSKPDCGNPFD